MKRRNSCSENVDAVKKKPKTVSENIVSPKISSPKGRSLYASYYEIMYIENIKYGFCLTCGKNDKGEFKIGFKITGHNTKSLRTHLQKCHVNIYRVIIKNGNK